ncbi:ribonuclease [Sphingomonas paeninsulae]|uniref:Ribonuclease n=1 Tax=Sphingomonas paeninsulae TaxID=2319844 RepID=A0A494TN26_SPHPE|nr:ribonuclease [Sphingomonas paeninsulae]AYJ86848.1 ribonuclease [Sphingomonas paeninsulae]
MAEWLYEAGIGEARAALVDDDDVIIEAHIEANGDTLRVGRTIDVRLVEKQAGGTRGIVRSIIGSHEALIDRLPAVDMGRAFNVTVVREAIPEPGAIKRAKVRLASDKTPDTAPDTGETPGPTLYDRIKATGITVRTLAPHGPDLLESAGWTETLEEAARGEIRFPGGALRISLTPAMTLIDIDGELAPNALALAGADAAGAAIRRLGIAGSIGIDFPTVAGKAERLAIAEAIDSHIPQSFERTAVNGFGFLQIIRPRLRASLCEQFQYDAIESHARALLRRAQRSGIIGAAAIVAHFRIIAVLEAQPDWIVALSAHIGGSVTLRGDAALAMSAGYATKAN